MNSYDVETYEDFLQAITELYDQNKLDFNNYKLLKKELESIENEHKQQKSEYRIYFKILESKIKNLVISGGGLTTTQEQQITSAYNHSQSAHAPANAEQNVQSNWTETNASSDAYIKNKPTLSTVATSGSYNDLTNKPSTIRISFNGNTYEPDSNGLITLPNISSGGSSGSIDTSNFIAFNNTYVSDCNLHYINGYAKTDANTLHLPNECTGGVNSWGIVFCILENSENGTGSQMYFPIDGAYKGRVFVRSVKNLKQGGLETSNWMLLDIVTNSDVPIDPPGEMK